MANLLVCLDSFAWHNLTLNRAKEMDDLILAVDKADDYGDTIYGHPDAYQMPRLDWGTINDLLNCDQDEYNFYTNGWFTYDHQKILIKLWRNATPGSSRDLTELEMESGFEGANNGLIGCFFQPLPDKFVYDEDSLEKLHQDYVVSRPSLRKEDPAYFYRHYKPCLRVSPNYINILIRKKRTHPCFLRLDSPTSQGGQILHGEKIQMHFTDAAKSCLNIDGTWKHGTYEIPQDARETLEDWGFILPQNQRL